VINKTYLNMVLKAAEEYCGSSLSEQYLALRSERERYLNGIWRKDIIPDKLDKRDQQKVLREIDFDSILHLAGKSLDIQKYYRLIYDFAKLSINFGEFKRSEKLLLLILQNREQIPERNLLGKAAHKLGNVYFYVNNYKESLRYYNDGLIFFTELEADAEIGHLKNAIGALKVEKGLYSEGETFFKEAELLAKRNKTQGVLIDAYNNLGNVYSIWGQMDQALNYYEKSQHILADDKDPIKLARLYIDISIAHRFQQKYKAAHKDLDQALALINKTNNKYQRGLAYLAKAEVACLEQDLSSSTAWVTSAFSIFSDLGDRLSVADAYRIMGMINRKREQYESSLAYLDNCIRMSQEYGNTLNLAEAYLEKGYLFKDMNEKKEAAKALEKANNLYTKLDLDAKREEIDKLLSDLK